MACLSLSFEEILSGAAGSVEAEAAARWAANPVLYTLPANLVSEDHGGLDMRVFDADFQSRRKRGSAAHLLPALQPQLGHGTEPARKADAKRPAPIAQRQRQRQQQQHSKLARGAAGPAAAQPQDNLYSSAAFLSHGDALGLASRRKARSSHFELPAGWQVVPASGSEASGAKHKGRKGAVSGSKQQHDGGRQYLSPEGLLLPSLQQVQAVVQGAVLVPATVVRWVRKAAADPGAAQLTLEAAAAQAHLLALLRMRVALVEEDRRQMQKRLAGAAGTPAGPAAHAREPRRTVRQKYDS